MKLILTVLLFISASVALSQKPDSLKCMGAKPDEFSNLAASAAKVHLIDVRLPFEYRKEHIEGAKRVRAGEKLAKASERWDKNAIILLYCTTGVRSCRSASLLNSKGFTHVWSLDGGIEAWKKQGLPVKRRIKLSR